MFVRKLGHLDNGVHALKPRVLLLRHVGEAVATKPQKLKRNHVVVITQAPSLGHAHLTTVAILVVLGEHVQDKR